MNSPATLEKLRLLVQSKLQSDPQIEGRIREFIENNEIHGKPVGDARETLLHDILSRLDEKESDHSPPETHRFIQIKVRRGSQFLKPAHFSKAPRLQLFLSFGSQRISSSPLPSASTFFVPSWCFLFNLWCDNNAEFEFNHEFILGSTKQRLYLLRNNSPIHLVLTNYDDDHSLFGTSSLEWRDVLLSGTASRKVDFTAPGSPSTPVGTLEVDLEILPTGSLQSNWIRAEELSMQRSIEHRALSEARQLFFLCAKQWRTDFAQIARQCRLTLTIESGEDVPVCSLISVLRAPGLIDSPLHAARFVSVIPVRPLEDDGIQCLSRHSFLSCGGGAEVEHALLLCSLLRGFMLEAYVCLDTLHYQEKPFNSHRTAFVITQGLDDTIVWDPITGSRFGQHSEAGQMQTHSWKVTQIFNETEFFSHCTPKQPLHLISFDLNNTSHWIPMDQQKGAAFVLGGSTIIASHVSLKKSSLDPLSLAKDLENELSHLILTHRRHLGLMTRFDSTLAYLLASSLTAYEQERLFGISVGNEEFQLSIKNYIPDGHSFRGFPIQYTHTNTAKMIQSLVTNESARAILETKGVDVYFAISIRVVCYPDNVVALWLMLATKYRD